MGIKRYKANKDTTITDAFKADLSTRGTAGNMGASDILETYSIYGQATSGSLERSRVLVQFPVDKILEDRKSTAIPVSGSVEFYVNLFNAPHGQTVPTNCIMSVAPILTSWDEGHGLDMEEFTNEESANWISASGKPDCNDGVCTGGTLWVNQGGDFFSGGLNTSDDFTYSQHFETGLENLSINITPLVEQWLSIQDGTSSVAASCKLKFGGQPASGSYVELSNAYGHTRRFVFNDSNSNAEQPDETIATGSDQAFYINVLIGGNQDATMTNLQSAISGSVYSYHSSSTQGIETDLNVENNFIALTSSYSGIPGNTKISMNGTTNITFESGDGISIQGFAGGHGLNNYGAAVLFSGSYEDGANERSYYTKKFFGRGSHHFFRTPVVEARWDSRLLDDREDIYLSSSLLPASQNLYKIYLYNYFAGNLYDIPSVDASAGELRVSFYPGTGSGDDAVKLPHDGGVYSVATNTEIRATRKETGVYEATFAITGSSGVKYYDVWKSVVSGTTTQIHTGSGFTVKSYAASSVSSAPSYVLSMPNLKQSYSVEETAKFRMTARLKDWQPTIYTKASNQVQLTIIKGAHYQIKRLSDNFIVIPFSTGSTNYSGLSYDTSGSYFDLDISALESNYAYELSFLFKINGSYKEQKDKFKFRVDS